MRLVHVKRADLHTNAICRLMRSPRRDTRTREHSDTTTAKTTTRRVGTNCGTLLETLQASCARFVDQFFTDLNYMNHQYREI